MTGVTVTELPVKLPVHVTVPVQPVAESTVLVPKHTLALLLLATGVAGFGVTVIVTAVLESLLQPFTVQRALYEVVFVGATVTELPVKLPVHVTVPAQPVAESTAPVPRQTLALLAFATGVAGFGVTVIVTAVLESLVQPFKLHTALNVVLLLGTTVIARPIKPPVQPTVPAQPTAVNNTLVPTHT